MSEEKLPAKQCQQRLAVLWLVGSGASFLLLFVQLASDKYGATGGDVTDWLLPSIIPTLTLMIGALVTANLVAKKKAEEEKEPAMSDRFLYRLAMGLSAFYLLLLFIVLLMSATTNIKTMIDNVGVMITSVQGLVGLALGAFFVKR
jgi:hypothetical protein